MIAVADVLGNPYAAVILGLLTIALIALDEALNQWEERDLSWEQIGLAIFAIVVVVNIAIVVIFAAIVDYRKHRRRTDDYVAMRKRR